MFKEIVINAGEEETRVAVLEDRVLVEMYIERSFNQRLVGNIFKGRVENVLPGMQAAFVDIGLEKNAFLYIEDALPPRSNGHSADAISNNISSVLKRGQEVVVQIIKGSFGKQGGQGYHAHYPARQVPGPDADDRLYRDFPED